MPARESATVMLLRDGAHGVEVYVMLRAQSMAFAAGMLAFPGGSRNASDGDLVDTALRETAEECGVELPGRESLRPWARWITPEHEPRRFDTMFYVAAVPAGIEPRATNTESEDAFWLVASHTAAESAEHGYLLLPPTITCLDELAAVGTVAAALAAPRRIAPVSPWPALRGDGVAVIRVDLDGSGGGLPRELAESTSPGLTVRDGS